MPSDCIKKKNVIKIWINDVILTPKLRWKFDVASTSQYDVHLCSDVSRPDKDSIKILWPGGGLSTVYPPPPPPPHPPKPQNNFTYAIIYQHVVLEWLSHLCSKYPTLYVFDRCQMTIYTRTVKIDFTYYRSLSQENFHCVIKISYNKH